MTVYLDTSVVLSWLLNQEPSIEDWGSWNAAYTSDICRVEFHRTIDRLRLSVDLDDDERVFLHERFVKFWRSVHRVRVGDTSDDGKPKPTPRSSARWTRFHLCSALIVADRRDGIAQFLTHDRQLAYERPEN